MTIEQLRTFLGWCAIGNALLLLVWYSVFVFAHKLVERSQARWFKLSPETFSALHYGGMGLFKMAIWMFNVIPYLVLRFAF